MPESETKGFYQTPHCSSEATPSFLAWIYQFVCKWCQTENTALSLRMPAVKRSYHLESPLPPIFFPPAVSLNPGTKMDGVLLVYHTQTGVCWHLRFCYWHFDQNGKIVGNLSVMLLVCQLFTSDWRFRGSRLKNLLCLFLEWSAFSFGHHKRTGMNSDARWGSWRFTIVATRLLKCDGKTWRNLVSVLSRVICWQHETKEQFFSWNCVVHPAVVGNQQEYFPPWQLLNYVCTTEDNFAASKCKHVDETRGSLVSPNNQQVGSYQEDLTIFKQVV